MISWRLLLWLLACLAALLLWQAWPASQGQVIEARWLWVEPQCLESRLGLVGRVQAVHQQIQAAPFDGVIAEVQVEPGQRVAPGQPLFRLDTAQLDIQIRQAEAEWLKARTSVRLLQGWESGPQVARARRAMFGARAALVASEAALADTRRLFERGIVARVEVDSLAQQVAAQREALQDAEQELGLVRERGQGDELRIAQMELANTHTRWQALLAQRERRVVRAPFAALVVRADHQGGGASRHLQPGQRVSQGAPLLTLVDLDLLQVLAAVQEHDLNRLREGLQVEVIIAGQPLAGQVQRIALQARNDEGQGAWYDVQVALQTPRDASTPLLRLGMTAQLTVIAHRSEQSIAVPAEALQVDEAGQAYVVYRAGGDRQGRKVPVTAGRAVAQGVEVLGLSAGYVRMP
ncbi:efflux RND transporter periplasmic adaptor subunit [Pseudomonas putida]|uniref:efflux RND transporter periplasmic adaptor subunit n=1 Tax=Pseudomonas putida TaxID=303 RepID=UPI001F524E82|nr:HlyD family efflux transporter periplasmic adaptor subunit [Pseudomonas putida]MCI0914831.1 HlyD family efflux transporter periplasmic adaptor subunit [Pseudomonas putida]